jgi:hypothetical protein
VAVHDGVVEVFAVEGGGEDGVYAGEVGVVGWADGHGGAWFLGACPVCVEGGGCWVLGMMRSLVGQGIS